MLVAVNFHYIREKTNYPFQSIHGIDPEGFRKQIVCLGDEGTFVSQEDIIRFLGNEKELPEKSILITFDDGLREQYEVALPILNELGVPAVFYVNPFNILEQKISNVHQIHLLRSFESSLQILERLSEFNLPISVSDREKELAIAHYNYDPTEEAILKYILNFKMNFHTKDLVINTLFEERFSKEEIFNFHESLYMTKPMLKYLDQIGFLGSHTYSHQPLGLLPSEKLISEFEKSHSFFQDIGVQAPRSVSYPYGSRDSCSQPVLDMAKQFQFQFGFTMERAGNRFIKENALRLARFDCNDVIGGKYSLFDPGKMFEQMQISSWDFSRCTT